MGGEFLRKAKRLADRKGLAFKWTPSRGKGSHGTLCLDDRKTVVKDLKKELGAGLFRAMCRDLGIHPDEF